MDAKEADERGKTQEDDTPILLGANTYTEQQGKNKTKVKPLHLSLHCVWLKTQRPRGGKTADGLTQTKKTSRRTAHITTTVHPCLGESFQKLQHKRQPNTRKRVKRKTRKREQEQQLSKNNSQNNIFPSTQKVKLSTQLQVISPTLRYALLCSNTRYKSGA